MNRSYRIGYSFQRRVKKYLEKKGWNCIVQPKSAFPDMVAWRLLNIGRASNSYNVIMVECKVNKYLSKEERNKALDLIQEKKCGKFYVAYRTKKKLNFYEMNLGNMLNLNYEEVKI